MIRRALFSMVFGMLGALAVQGALWLALPQPPKFAQVDLVAITKAEVEGMARDRMRGGDINAQTRAMRLQEAIETVAAESGRIIMARQAFIAGATDDVPDLTFEVRRRMH